MQNEKIKVDQGEFVFIWTSVNYIETEVLIMDENKVNEFVTKDHGFDSNDLENILRLDNGDIWQDDVNGLKVIKI